MGMSYVRQKMEESGTKIDTGALKDGEVALIEESMVDTRSGNSCVSLTLKIWVRT